MELPSSSGNIENGGDQQQGGPIYFGNYEAVKAIGKGKFAIVYRAHRIGEEQVVALKRISVDMMNDKAREKCLKEVRLLQSLDHPNIIRYMDSFICENDLIIIYEWAAAGDLKRQIRKAQEKGGGFEERVIWKYFSQIANAIQFMHEKRIMHRDLKPANIFLTLDGTIKVGDLGLSREFSEHTHQAHSKVGTPLYMSPEVIKGVDGYDFKSDIWSLGCLLYELAVLKSPFKSEGINLYSLLHKISNGEYSPIPDHYSDELRDLAHAMISTRPEDRPDIGHICDMAARMRQLTSTDRSNKLKRSCSKSDDFTGEGIAEIKNEATKPVSLEEELHFETKELPPRRTREANEKEREDKKPTMSRFDYDEEKTISNHRVADFPSSSSLPQKPSSNPFQSFRTPSSEENKGNVSSAQTSVYRRQKPRPESASRPTSKISRPSTVDADNESPPQNPNPLTDLSPHLENASQAFAAMDIVYGKLQLLEYPMTDETIDQRSIASKQRARGHLLPIHFAVNLQLFFVAAHETSYQFQQFHRMVAVIQWLCSQRIKGAAGEAVQRIDLRNSNSVTIAKQLLLAAQVAAPMSEEVAAISPSALLPGFGLPVCQLLNHFLDAALKGFSPKPMIYPEDSVEADNADGVFENNDIEDEVGDTDRSAVAPPDEEEVAGEEGGGREDESDLVFSLSNSARLGRRGVIELGTSVDPTRWREEVERVVPQLRKREKALDTSSSQSWQSRVQVIRGYSFIQTGPSSENAMTESIRGIQSQLSEHLLAVGKAERLISSRQDFESLQLQYQSHKQKLEEYQRRGSEINTKIIELTNSLSEKEESLEEVKETLQSKLGGGRGGGEELNPVIQFKEAIQRLQREIREMFVTSQFLDSQLLQRKKESHFLSLQKTRRSAHRRKKRGKAAADPNHRLSSLSSEEEEER